MTDAARRLTGLAVTATALTAVLALQPSPSGPVPRPADFGATPSPPPARAATSTRVVDVPAHRSEVSRHDPAPERVQVPGVGIDAAIRPVGVDDQGALSVPGDPTVTGWYRFGPAPGSAHGSAVLVGHVDNDTGAVGEFAALYEVKAGDRVEVHRDGAGPATYRVVSRSTVPKDRLPPSLFRRVGPPVLTLITCAPPFRPGLGGYQSNLIVTAEPPQS
ncbi:class F sortase [Streptomyces sp. NPDC093568]|uniref:class F sortase n=1 Tax=Streptomyces sp. NPDC093568 TaxID=3366041 RepID=UPI003812DCEE